MQVRIGTVLGVPVEQDMIEIGTVADIRMGRVHLTSVSVSVQALEYVQVRVGRVWYSLGDCAQLDAECNLVSLEVYAYSKLG